MAGALALGARFLTQLGELALMAHPALELGPVGTRAYAWFTVLAHLVFAFLLSRIGPGQESHYVVLLVIPVIASAFWFSLPGLVFTVAGASLLTILQVWVPLGILPRGRIVEYFEATTVALIFVLVAIVARLLAQRLWDREAALKASLAELDRTRDRLLREERLAAIGRLSSAIAHEIRNPVAMIASSAQAAARAEGPLVALNCAAMPESLLESELFGHEKGAFTGADRARPGLFEAAHEGTLFLDEAGEMPASLQAKLLRVLMDGLVLRVGSRTARQVDVRVVAATHRDLRERIREGLFREDLYYRLAVVPLKVPPLRERLEDLPLLAEAMLQRAARDMGLPLRRFAPAALERLAGYAFPGNVRELRNLIERACILAQGAEIGPGDFPLEGPLTPVRSLDPEAFAEGLPPAVNLPEVLDRVERSLLDRALRQSGGVQAEAARTLGISRSDLHYKLKRRQG
jgi:transcriptional regulator of acetoin/glycerol metabolism